MIELPDVVSEYLHEELLASARPFCLLIGDDGKVLQSWGDGRWCGLDGIAAGDDVFARAPWLHGLPGDEVSRLRNVKSVSDVNFHVHVLPAANGYFVVMLDAQREHDALRERQQWVNELRLVQSQQLRLIERQRTLISELVETRSELDHHRREAERSSDNKSRFIAMMSHEFRTPLASIINYAELARERDASATTIGKSIEAISRSARHLTSLVEALLDEARLGAGQLELQVNDFTLYDLLADVADMMAPLAAEKGLSFATQIDSDVPNLVRADDVRLRQILINLLGNAIKYTTEGSVRLVVDFHDGRLVATVSDTGPGISADEQERVFRAFERGSRQAAGGAGLGLTITLKLAELMGGEISLDSMPGHGCTVSLYVPVEASSANSSPKKEALPTPEANSVATKPLSILICDDDEDMIALVEHYLHRSGYGLVTTTDSSEAVAKTLKYDPDLVLLDCNVPGISGVDAARLLRQRGYDKPIVALTASSLTASEQGVFSLYFRKPAPMQELLGAIKRLTH